MYELPETIFSEIEATLDSSFNCQVSLYKDCLSFLQYVTVLCASLRPPGFLDPLLCCLPSGHKHTQVSSTGENTLDLPFLPP